MQIIWLKGNCEFCEFKVKFVKKNNYFCSSFMTKISEYF